MLLPGGFRGDTDFNDVTLACEDGTHVEAHKVTLSASGPLFTNLLRSERHSHPLIFVVGVRSEDLVSAVDFLFRGEAKVNQENKQNNSERYLHQARLTKRQ